VKLLEVPFTAVGGGGPFLLPLLTIRWTTSGSSGYYPPYHFSRAPPSIYDRPTPISCECKISQGKFIQLCRRSSVAIGTHKIPTSYMDSAAPSSTKPRSLNCLFFRNDAKYEIINHATMDDHTQEEEQEDIDETNK
jgi:hypothetical protein